MDAGDADEDSSATNEDMYNDMVKPTILDVISGYNASIISYGQTGTGKTYTMSGGPDVSSVTCSVSLVSKTGCAHLVVMLQKWQNHLLSVPPSCVHPFLKQV